MSKASELIKVAKAEVGYLEKKTNSQLQDKTANAGYNNYTKYANDFDKTYTNFYNGKKNGYAWCDMFVDWCMVKAFGEAKALELLCQPKKSCGAGCYFSANYYKSKGRLYKTPKVGDQIFLKNSKGVPCHTGIVEKVDSTYVYTIEGNTSSASGVVANGGCVAEKKYKKSYASIYGYGRPKYDETETTTSSESTNNKTIDELAKEVINGKYGNGDARKKALGNRYAEVQKRVDELLSKTTATTKTHKVQRNETLSSIAKKYDTSVNEIVNKNKSKYPSLVWNKNYIKVGWVLTI